MPDEDSDEDSEGIRRGPDEESDEGDPEPTVGALGALKRLEEEGEVAADYLEELLDIVDLDGDIDIDVENGRASVAIVDRGRPRTVSCASSSGRQRRGARGAAGAVPAGGPGADR